MATTPSNNHFQQQQQQKQQQQQSENGNNVRMMVADDDDNDGHNNNNACASNNCNLLGNSGGNWNSLQQLNNQQQQQLEAARAAAYQTQNKKEKNTTTLDIEVDLAKEMNKLTVEEREHIYDEVHGVANIQEETSEFVERIIKEFDIALLQYPKHKRFALTRAIFLRPRISNDKQFKLLFLRADYFNVTKSIERFVKHYQQKEELFGYNKVAKDITLNDLSCKDLECYENLSVLPGRDRSGRPLVLGDQDVTTLDKDEIMEMLRVEYHYLMASVREDLVASKKGLCVLIYCSSRIYNQLGKYISSIYTIKELATRYGNMMDGLPVRYTSFHLCSDMTAIKYVMLDPLVNGLGTNVGLRLRTHVGSTLEIQYSLSSFGINCEGFLGHLQQEVRNESIEKRRKEIMAKHFRNCRNIETKRERQRLADEDESSGSGIILYPTENDVLLGSGKQYQDYSGNRLYRSLVKSQFSRYDESNDRMWKMSVSLEVVKQIKEFHRGRFLTRIDGIGWKVVDDTVAKNKTSVAFRSLRAYMKNNSNK